MTNRFYQFAIAAVLCCSFTSQSNATVVLSWNTVGNTGTETTEASIFNLVGVTASNLTLGAGVNAVGNGNRFGGNNWFDTGDTNPTTLAESISGNDYIEFIVTPTGGATFTATSFDFIWGHSATGPNSVALRSSLDNFGADLGSLTGLVDTTTNLSIISIAGVQDIAVATTFRLYGYGATGTTGTGGFDTANGATVANVNLNGSVTAVPEPSTFGLLGLAGFAFVARRSRKS